MTYEKHISNNEDFNFEQAKKISSLAKERKGEEFLFVFQNTKGIHSTVFRQLCGNPNIKIRVKGGLDEVAKPKYNHNSYIQRTIYSPEEMTAITKTFEKIEDKINPRWSNLAKAAFVYERLAKTICYDYDSKHEYDKGRDMVRTLNGVTSKYAVCAGFALIFKESMDRIGVPCRYINKPSSHSWNSITVNGKEVNVDLTWDAVYFDRKKSNCFDFFGQNAKEFYSDKAHKADASEFPLPNAELSVGELKAALKEIAPNKVETMSINNVGKLACVGTINNRKTYALTRVLDGGKLSPITLLTSERDLFRTDMNEALASSLINLTPHPELSIFKEGEVGFDSRKVKNYQRKDGSVFMLISTPSSKYSGVNQYRYLEPKLEIGGGLSFLQGTIYSEQDLLHPKTEQDKVYVANNLLEKSRVENKLSNVGGYVGFMNGSQKTYNPSLERKIGNYVR
ncbi:MAG: hypothetical protein R3Y43_02500 [Alphaproteobacteria bacterium]